MHSKAEESVVKVKAKVEVKVKVEVKDVRRGDAFEGGGGERVELHGREAP